MGVWMEFGDIAFNFEVFKLLAGMKRQLCGRGVGRTKPDNWDSAKIERHNITLTGTRTERRTCRKSNSSGLSWTNQRSSIDTIQFRPKTD